MRRPHELPATAGEPGPQERQVSTILNGGTLSSAAVWLLGGTRT